MAGSARKLWTTAGPVIALIVLGSVAYNLLGARNEEQPGATSGLIDFTGASRTEAITRIAVDICAANVGDRDSVRYAAQENRFTTLHPGEINTSEWRTPKHAGIELTLLPPAYYLREQPHPNAQTYGFTCSVRFADGDTAAILDALSQPENFGTPAHSVQIVNAGVMHAWSGDRFPQAEAHFHISNADDPHRIEILIPLTD